jgi:hypothetical protein
MGEEREGGKENERERQSVRALSHLRSCARFGLPGLRIQRKQPPAPEYSAPEPLGTCCAVHQACDPFRLVAAAGQGAGLAAAAQPRLVTRRAQRSASGRTSKKGPRGAKECGEAAVVEIGMFPSIRWKGVGSGGAGRGSEWEFSVRRPGGLGGGSRAAQC